MPGPTGPTGLQGPTGPTGPTGTFGPTGTCKLNLDRVAKRNWYGGPVGGVTDPYGVIYDGKNIWVCSKNTSSVSQFNACDGAFVQTLSGGSYNFNFPQGIAFDGVNIWVTNSVGNSVTAFSATDGSFVMNISGGSFNFSSPTRIIFDGTYLWTVNFLNATATAFDTTGTFHANTTGGGKINNPVDLSFDGTNIWITNTFTGFADNVVVIDNTGALVTSFNGSFGDACGIVFDGTLMWVGFVGTSEVTAYDIGTFAVALGPFSGAPYNFNFMPSINQTCPFVFDGIRVWVTNTTPGGGTMTLLNAFDGSWVNTIGSSAYGFNFSQGAVFDGIFVWVTNNGNNTLSNVYV